MTFSYNNNNNNNNPSYPSQYPNGGIPPIVFNPHNPNNRENGYGYDSYNNNNNNADRYGGCSTLSAIQRFRSLFPYASGYSATCNTCDWDYCNKYNGGNKRSIRFSVLFILFAVYLRNVC